jgi:hypothetical protein
LASRAWTAFFAIAERCSAVSFFARALPPSRANSENQSLTELFFLIWEKLASSVSAFAILNVNNDDSYNDRENHEA